MLAADGKMRLTDVADTERIFRLVQSIPSPKAEPFKLWIAKVARQGGTNKKEEDGKKIILQFQASRTGFVNHIHNLRHLSVCR